MKNSIIKIFTLVTALVLVWACDPMSEIYDELDENPTPITADLQIVLTPDDYELSGVPSAEKYKSFSSVDDAKEGIPNILSALYPQLGATSSALVEYDLYQGSVSYIYDDYEADYVGGVVTNPIPVYTVTEADYDAVLGPDNYGSFNSLEQIRGFLAYKYPNPSQNQGVLLTYQYYSGNTETLTNTFSYEYGVWYEQRVLSQANGDYAYMGRSGDYFSSIDMAEERIPVWLDPQFPYAKTGERYLVQYLYRDYDDEDEDGVPKEMPRLVLSEYIDGAWVMVGSVIPALLQLGNNGTAWVPDNTIKYDMSSSDYEAVSVAYAGINPAGSESMATYGNYDVSLWTDEQIEESISGVLLNNFPASEQGQKYLVFYKVYAGGTETRSIHLILSGDKYVLVGTE